MSCSSELTDHDTEEQPPATLKPPRPVPSASPTRTSPSSTPAAKHHAEPNGSEGSHKTRTGPLAGSDSNDSRALVRLKPKRRRLDYDLGFSSPGPAFMIPTDDDLTNSSEAESSGTGRLRRTRRSAAAAASSLISTVQNQRQRSMPFPKAVQARQRGPVATEASDDAAGRVRSPSSSETSLSLSDPTDEDRGDLRDLDSTVGDEGSPPGPPQPSSRPPSPSRRFHPTITPVSVLMAQKPFEEMLAQRRHEKLAASQAELEQIHDSHDTLVRELFHLVKFVTLIGYDPEVAKQDRSEVFAQFQQEHDLRFALAASEAGPSGPRGRITRRGVNARLEGLSLFRNQPTTPAGATSATPTPASSAIRRAEGSARSRRSASLSLDADPDVEGDAASPLRNVKGKRLPGQQPSGSIRESRTRLSANGRAVEAIGGPSMGKDAKRKGAGASAPSNGNKKEAARPIQARLLPEVPPPIHALGPQHVPPPPRFKGSVTELWDSFRFVEDEDLEPTRADELERQELELLLRIDRGKRGGLALDESAARAAHLRPHVVTRQRDHHDHLLEAMISASQQIRQHHKHRANLARKTSRMVATYWERVSGSSERERRAEERRVRALAKWTVREVAKQWRLAVNVVRARKVAAEKAQKEKLDKEQLNAILEKSTQMLQKQHEEMARMELDSQSERSLLTDDEDDDEDIDDITDDDGSEDESEGQDDHRSEIDYQSTDGSIGDVESPASDDKPKRLVDGTEGREDPVEPRDSGGAQPAASSSPVPRSPSHEERFYDALAPAEDTAPPQRDAAPREGSRSSGAGQTEDARRDSIAADAGEASLAPSIKEEASESIVAASETRSRHSIRSRRSTRSAPMSSPSHKGRAEDPDQDAYDADFSAIDADAAAEDEELERRMWEEDEEDESEDAGLAADADVPIEELLQRYGYGDQGDGSTEGGDVTDTPSVVEDDAAVPLSEQRTERDAEASPRHRSASRATDDATVPAMPPRPSKTSADPRHDVADDSESDNDGTSDVNSAVDTGSRKPRSRSMTRASSALSSERAGGAGGRSRQPFLLRGQLRPYQQIGFEWLAGLYANGVNGILADEMGLGKTIQTISLLAHLACDKGVWGPHLVVAPTSVMLNWEVEFKKFLPGFKILSYFGNQKERKGKRIGWNTENSFNVCITSYQIVLADQHIFRRKPWVYLVLDEAHHIKNFRSQRWQTLLGFNSQRRLLLTGTPLQNNLMDLWSLMYFLMPHGVSDLPGGGAFANMKDFQEWFSNPLDRAIESGQNMDEEMRTMIHKLHTVLRPYLLRRLKSEVEKEMPRKYEHVITCRLSKRQRFLYNDFMSRAKTRESLASGNYLSIINCLMQLRKVCNHPDLFEVRPIVTSFAMPRSVVADYEIRELLVRRRLLQEDTRDRVDLDVTNWRITSHEEHLTPILTRDLRRLNASTKLPFFREPVPDPPPLDTWSQEGFAQTLAQRRHRDEVERWKHVAYVNQYRCTRRPIYGRGLIALLRTLGAPTRLLPLEEVEPDRRGHLDRCDNVSRLVQSRAARLEALHDTIDRFAFVTPRAVAVDMARWALPGLTPAQSPELLEARFDTLHPVAVKLHIAFPDASLLQYDCGKLQQLDVLMRRLKEGGHRILIFTQMTKVLDILETFLNYHGYRYLRLDGATKVEDRQALTEKFNRDLRISAFILSTRSGGLGINLTGADTVLFYDLDWNAAIEAQCMDRAHRIGQTRDVHIYRFVSEHTIEENMLRKANQKRRLEGVVIQEGGFTADRLVANKVGWRDMLDDEGGIEGVKVGEVVGEEETALEMVEDEEDRRAAQQAREEMGIDFERDFNEVASVPASATAAAAREASNEAERDEVEREQEGEEDEEQEEEGGTIDEYMLRFVEADWDYFA
ncbi:swr1 complex component [Thecaphora frezii]